MENLVFLLSFVCLCFVSGENNVSMDAVLERLNYLENKVAEQESINEELRRQCNPQSDLSPSKRFIMEPSEGAVGFTAAITPHIVYDVNPSEIIKFDTLVTSIGGGYNNQTGIFVAPMSGVYMFSCSLLDHVGEHRQSNGTMVHAEIRHNQRLLARVFAHASTAYRDQGAQTVIAKIQQGDQVFIRSVDNPSLALGGDFYSTFSGYLLQLI